MKAANASLAERRARLLAQIAVERSDFATRLRHWRAPLAAVDLAWSVACFVRRHPLAMACGYGALRLVLRQPVSRIAHWWRRGRQLRAAVARSG